MLTLNVPAANLTNTVVRLSWLRKSGWNWVELKERSFTFCEDCIFEDENTTELGVLSSGQPRFLAVPGPWQIHGGAG